MNKCRPISRDFRICYVESLIKDFYGHAESCVLSLFKARLNLKERCDMRLIYAKRPIWAKVHRRNTWLFLVPEVDRGIVTCRNGPGVRSVSEKATVSGRGFLTLRAGCQYVSDSVFVAAQGDYKAQVQIPFEIPKINVTLPLNLQNLLRHTHRIPEFNQSFHLRPTTTHIYDLVRMSHQANEIKNMMDEVEMNRLHVITDNREVAMVSGVSILLIAFLVYRFRGAIGSLITLSFLARRQHEYVTPREVGHLTVPLNDLGPQAESREPGEQREGAGAPEAPRGLEPLPFMEGEAIRRSMRIRPPHTSGKHLC